MNLIRNLRHYPFHVILFISVFFVTFFVATFVPVWIDNQQGNFISTQINSLPYDVYLNIPGHLNNNNYDNNAQNFSIIKKALFIETMTIIGATVNNLNSSNSLIGNGYSSLRMNIISLSNNTFTDIKTLLNTSLLEPLQNNEILIDSFTSQQLHLKVGDNVLLSTYIYDSTSRQLSISKNISTFKVGGIFLFSDDLLKTIYPYNYLYYSSEQSNSFFIVSNSKMEEIASKKINSNGVYFVYIGISAYLTYNLANSTLIDKTSVQQSIQNVDLMNKEMNILLGGTNYNSYDSPLVEQLINIFNEIVKLQIFFLIVLIPPMILAILIVDYCSKSWIEVRKPELFVFYTKGNNIRNILQYIQNDLFQLALIGYITCGLIEYILFSWLQWDISNTLLLYIIIGLFFLIIYRFYLSKRGLTITPKMIVNQDSQNSKDNYFDSDNEFWSLKLRHYILIFLGTIPILLQIIDFLAIQYGGIFNLLENAIGSYNAIILIFAPIFSFYGATFFLFFALHKLYPKFKSKIPTVLKNNFFEDLTRNKREIFHMFIFFALAITFILGPIYANDIILNQDQRQLQAFYGTDYSTGFITSTFNITTLSKELNSVQNVQWSLAIETTGAVALLNSQRPVLLIYVTSNYFNIVNNSPLSHNTIEKFLQSPQSALYTQTADNDIGLQPIPDSKVPKNIIISYYDYQENLKTLNLSKSGTFTYLPGIYIGPNGYEAPYGTYYNSVSWSMAIFTHLPTNYVLSSNDLINLFFTINQENKTAIINQLENITRVPINTNRDPSTHEFMRPIGSNTSGIELVTLAFESMILLSILDIILLIIFLLIFMQKYIFQRRYELGIFRARGYTQFQIYKLICYQILLIVITGTLWGILNGILYSLTIATNIIANNLIPIVFYLSNNTIMITLILIIVFIFVGSVRSLLIYKHSILYYLNRRV